MIVVISQSKLLQCEASVCGCATQDMESLLISQIRLSDDLSFGPTVPR